MKITLAYGVKSGPMGALRQAPWPPALVARI